MVDDLYDLVLGENGFLVKLRCKNEYDEIKYSEIKETMKNLVNQWKKMDSIPKKGFLTIIELVEFLARSSNFLSKEDSIKTEDASIEIKDIINELYLD